jgi:hypothetical protein
MYLRQFCLRAGPYRVTLQKSLADSASPPFMMVQHHKYYKFEIHLNIGAETSSSVPESKRDLCWRWLVFHNQHLFHWWCTIGYKVIGVAGYLQFQVDFEFSTT